MKKFSLLVFLLCFAITSFSQEKKEKKQAIATFENLMYNEFYLGEKCYTQAKINPKTDEGLIEIDEEYYFGEGKHTKRKRSFYVEDLDLKSMKYDMRESEPGLYFVLIQIEAKGNSIENYSVEINKTKFPVPVSETTYLDKLSISPMGKSLPQRHAERLIESVKLILGAENYEKAQLFKV